MDAEDYQPSRRTRCGSRTCACWCASGLELRPVVDRLNARPKIATRRGGFPAISMPRSGIAALGAARHERRGWRRPCPRAAAIRITARSEETRRFITATIARRCAHRPGARRRIRRQPAGVSRALDAKIGRVGAKLAPLPNRADRRLPQQAGPISRARFRLDLPASSRASPACREPVAPCRNHPHHAGARRRIVVREPYEPERDVAFVASRAGASVVTLAASVGALPRSGDYIALFRCRRPRRCRRRPRCDERVLLFLWPPFLVSVCLVGIHAFSASRCSPRKVIFVDLGAGPDRGARRHRRLHGRPSGAERPTYGYSLGLHACPPPCCSAFTRGLGHAGAAGGADRRHLRAPPLAAILLSDRAQGRPEHLKADPDRQYPHSGLDEIPAIVPLYAAVGALHWLLRRRLAGDGSLALGIRLLRDLSAWW